MTIAARIEQYLTEHGVRYELVSHKTTGSTHESAVAAHVPDDHIAKGVMVRDAQGDAMVVIPGHSWLRLDTLNQETGRQFELNEESALTHLFPDCTPGAVPPLGPAYDLETLLDEAFASLGVVYCEAGDHQHLLRISGEDFRTLLQGARRGYFSGESSSSDPLWSSAEG